MSWLKDALAPITKRNETDARQPRVHDWTRYWCPRGGIIDLSDGGFLVEPGVSLFQAEQDAVPFSSISDKRCLVLLGEPGIGKSVASHDEYVKVASRPGPESHHYVDLRGYSELELRDKLFEADFLKAWLAADNELLLYLDSLDECLDRVEHVAHLLREELSTLPHDRLRLRIVCRTADWPTELEQHLRDWWGRDDVGVFELAPLTRRNAADAASAESIDPQTFLRQVEEMQLGPLASKPLALDMLLNIYLDTGSLPESQADVYRRGCLLLCDETEQQRRRRRRGPSAEQRLAIAERIAAAMILSNKRAVWTTPDRGDVPADDAVPSEFVGGVEGSPAQSFEVEEAAIRDVMTTGLFSARGPQEMGWAHLSYGEFLAASRLADPDLPLASIKALLAHPGDPGCLTPQLRELAGWLAGMRDDVRGWVLDTEPRVVLRSDAAALGMHDRAALVDALIAEAGSKPTRIFSFGTRPLLRKLAHAGLSGQLRAVLLDKTRSLEERTFACDIAEVNGLTELHDVLTAIAFDPDEPHDLRVDATRTIATTGSPETKVALKSLLDGGIDDPTDDLPGWALRALWPDTLQPEEVFAMLIPYGEQTRFGAYWAFLTSDLVPKLPAERLTTALAWTRTSGLDVPTIDTLHQVICQIFERAWSELARDDTVAQAFAEAALVRLERHYELCQHRHDSDLEDLIATGETERRALANKIVGIMAARDDDLALEANRVAHASPRLVRAEDLPWLAQRMGDANEAEQRVIAQLMYSAFDSTVDGCLKAVVETSERYPATRELLQAWLGPIEIDSEEAASLKSSYEQRESWKRERQPPEPERPVAEIAAALLQKFEDGEWDAWWRLNMALKAPAGGKPAAGIGEPDLTATPGWAVVKDATKARAVAAARKYLETGGCSPEEWLGKGVFYWPAEAGYAALRLLIKLDPASVEMLDRSTWDRWAAIVVAHHSEHTSDGHDLQKVLVQGAFHGAPEAVVSTLVELIKQEDAKHGNVFVLERMPPLSGQSLQEELLGLVERSDISSAGTESVLMFLSPTASDRVRTVGLALLERRDADPERATGAAVALLTTQPGDTLDQVMDLFEGDEQYAKTVMMRVADKVHWKARGFTQSLSEEQLARLFRWLEANVTPAPEGGKVRALGPPDFLRDLLNYVLGELSKRGSQEAVAVLRALLKEYPQDDGLPWILEEAEETMRRTTWIPPSPGEVVAILRAPQKRLVQSAQDLLGIVIESLDRLQARLQGETPQAQFLWNLGARKRPKDEEALSDFVKDHLQRDLQERGVIAGREVEIRKGQGGAPGEVTDIHISAVRLPDRARSALDVVCLIIETKGNWHRELLTAMKAQLVDRYLTDNDCRHGLYLVGWFNCSQWDDEDAGKRRAMRHDLDQLRAQLNEQAASLSTNDLTISAVVLDAHLR